MTAALGSLLVEPVPRLVGHVAVPGDKSISHRSVWSRVGAGSTTVVSPSA